MRHKTAPTALGIASHHTGYSPCNSGFHKVNERFQRRREVLKSHFCWNCYKISRSSSAAGHARSRLTACSITKLTRVNYLPSASDFANARSQLYPQSVMNFARSRSGTTKSCIEEKQASCCRDRGSFSLRASFSPSSNKINGKLLWRWYPVQKVAVL